MALRASFCCYIPGNGADALHQDDRCHSGACGQLRPLVCPAIRVALRDSPVLFVVKRLNMRCTKVLGVLLPLIIAPLRGYAAEPAAPALTLAVFPRWNAQVMVRNFTPLAKWLGRELGREVRLETDKDFDSFMRRVLAGEFDLVHLNQLQYVQAHQAAGYRVIAKLCESRDCTIAAAIVVRNDSDINRLGDLRNKIVAFGDPNAMVSYVLARSVLRAAGVDASQYRTIFTKNPPNALFAVYNGAADAAGVSSKMFSRPDVAQRLDMKQLRVLAESQPIPQLPLAVRRDMNPQLVQQVLSVLLDLSRQTAGVDLLKKLGLDRFEPANDAEYGIIKRLATDDTAR